MAKKLMLGYGEYRANWEYDGKTLSGAMSLQPGRGPEGELDDVWTSSKTTSWLDVSVPPSCSTLTERPPRRTSSPVSVQTSSSSPSGPRPGWRLIAPERVLPSYSQLA